jgi:hypothetical protein
MIIGKICKEKICWVLNETLKEDIKAEMKLRLGTREGQ